LIKDVIIHKRSIVDTQAEQAVRDAMAGPEPHNKVTVPDRARRALGDDPRGSDRVYRAIAVMVSRGELEAPIEPWKSWKLLK
jgi:hypothetical protein